MVDYTGRTRPDYLAMELQNMGLFVRDYSPEGKRRLYDAAVKLHTELCKLDSTNIEEWMKLPLIEFVNAIAKVDGMKLITKGK
tara:strand:+ start:1198 stop:1446 length:249 start_codon:yes stop_codon:yes gene_type:complete